MTYPILFDTDMGDDIDDALALALICASPELELRGVSTVFGNVAARSRQARTILKLAGPRFAGVAVAAGCGAAMGRGDLAGRGAAACLAGTLPNQDAVSLPEDQLPPADMRHGVQLIIDTILAGGGKVVVITVGALTNLAAAMVLEPRIVPMIPQIIAMAGEFRLNRPEYNILCDPEAAAIIFRSGVPMRVTGWEMGKLASFTQVEVAQIDSAAGAVGQYLSRAIAAWRAWMNNPAALPALFDPLAVASLIEPGLMQWETGDVTVELQGQATYGYTVFRKRAGGPHQVGVGVDRARAVEFFLQRVMAERRSNWE